MQLELRKHYAQLLRQTPSLRMNNCVEMFITWPDGWRLFGWSEDIGDCFCHELSWMRESSKMDDLRLEHLLAPAQVKLKDEGTINEQDVAASGPQTHSIVSPTSYPRNMNTCHKYSSYPKDCGEHRRVRAERGTIHCYRCGCLGHIAQNVVSDSPSPHFLANHTRDSGPSGSPSKSSLNIYSRIVRESKDKTKENGAKRWTIISWMIMLINLRQMRIFSQQSSENGVNMVHISPYSICERPISKYMCKNHCSRIRM